MLPRNVKIQTAEYTAHP